ADLEPVPVSSSKARTPTMQRTFQAAGWLFALAIVALSLSPPTLRPITGVGHDLEHLVIFLAAGTAFGLGYPLRLRLLAIAWPTFAGVIEIAQIWVPGRHARLGDFVIDAAVACCGVGLAYLRSKFGKAEVTGEHVQQPARSAGARRRGLDSAR